MLWPPSENLAYFNNRTRIAMLFLLTTFYLSKAGAKLQRIIELARKKTQLLFYVRKNVYLCKLKNCI